ncbi:hypothetical protein GCM10010435_16410 [Winogradskya consettensis]|uniref:Uncharacterized protein n=1 Tax=Winogradskya consettensis TaxID=113560 RepID=A0A919VXU7_9ACTN|nr:hypothetical protein [Actinoplanes consettensis]GIM78865.1 hypothetical protein Aco04nite_62640 [Actinoplanes consettensis]
MSHSALDRLTSLQDEIHAAGGGWGAGARAAIEVPGFGGDPDGVRGLARVWDEAAGAAEVALATLTTVEGAEVAGVWAGNAHNAAAEVVRALADEVARAAQALRDVSGQLRAYGEGIESEQWRDRTGQAVVRESPIEGVDLRVAAHISARSHGEDLAVGLHDAATQARAHLLDEPFLAPVDDIVVADTGVLTPAMAVRASEALFKAPELVVGAESAELRAYLMKGLAAGYGAADLAVFETRIASHDAEWLDRHLSPLDPDRGPVTARRSRTPWSQGPLPTCVAASTVTVRAEVDPIYALSITDGDFDERLRAEQLRVYDGGRSWIQDALGRDGMTAGQSEQVANEEIGPRAGVTYDNVALTGDVLDDVERAADDGYPVPFITDDHQLVVTGHTDDQLQVYNPWGYTYWISEDEFLDGSPGSVRLPRTG